jgi:hypothetical protein
MPRARCTCVPPAQNTLAHHSAHRDSCPFIEALSTVATSEAAFYVFRSRKHAMDGLRTRVRTAEASEHWALDEQHGRALQHTAKAGLSLLAPFPAQHSIPQGPYAIIHNADEFVAVLNAPGSNGRFARISEDVPVLEQSIKALRVPSNATATLDCQGGVLRRCRDCETQPAPTEGSLFNVHHCILVGYTDADVMAATMRFTDVRMVLPCEVRCCDRERLHSMALHELNVHAMQSSGALCVSCCSCRCTRAAGRGSLPDHRMRRVPAGSNPDVCAAQAVSEHSSAGPSSCRAHSAAARSRKCRAGRALPE